MVISNLVKSCSPIVICLAILSGCATTDNGLWHQKALVKTYDINFEQAWNIAREIFKSNGYPVYENTRERSMTVYKFDCTGEYCFPGEATMNVWLTTRGSNGNISVAIRILETPPENYKIKFTEVGFHEKFLAHAEKLRKNKSWQ